MTAGRNKNSRSGVRIKQRFRKHLEKEAQKQELKVKRKAKKKSQKFLKKKNKILGEEWKPHRNAQRARYQARNNVRHSGRKKTRIYITETKFVIGLKG